MTDLLESRLTYAAQRVFDELGAGQSESVYEAALEVDLFITQNNIKIRRQVPCPIVYRQTVVGCGYIDMLLDDIIIVEIKTIAKLTEKDIQQVRKYKTGTVNRRFLINFNPTKEKVEVVKVEQSSAESGD